MAKTSIRGWNISIRSLATSMSAVVTLGFFTETSSTAKASHVASVRAVRKRHRFHLLAERLPQLEVALEYPRAETAESRTHRQPCLRLRQRQHGVQIARPS